MTDEDQADAVIAVARRAHQRELAYYRKIGHKGPLPPEHFLAISGGGDNGAFGAGLLVGWTEHGTRPQFRMVTGISTGSLIAPYAFLGPRYDQALAKVYTTIDSDDILRRRPILLAALTEDALADSAPLQHMISTYLTDEMVREIGAEYDKGRILLIGTTNLDAGKAVVWNIGAIAKSGHPNAPKLIRRVLLASASVPGLFPPVMFDVMLDGMTYQEMHGDGGATRQEFLYPSEISRRKLPPSMRARKRTAYVIRNGKLAVQWEQVERRTLPIAGRAISTLLASSGVDGLYRIYLSAQRDGVDYNLAFIDQDFSAPHKEMFDREYMDRLFAYAKAKAKTGYPWRKRPPGFTR